MRLCVKLMAMIMLFTAIQRALPVMVQVSAETSFTFRCGLAHWTGNERLREQLVEEAREMLFVREHRTTAATQRVAEAEQSGSFCPLPREEFLSALSLPDGITVEAVDPIGGRGGAYERSAAPATVR